MIDRADVTGVVLAGGRGSRMGGVDKGLQLHNGVPLALHAARRLATQVATLGLSANRHIGTYRAFGLPVWADAQDNFLGPLAGFVSALRACETPFLVAVPCDSPDFPLDLVARLATPMTAGDVDVSVARCPAPALHLPNEAASRIQPVFCLMRSSVLGRLESFLSDGNRKIELWLRSEKCAEAWFDDASAFFNANTADELRSLQRAHDDKA